MAAKKQPDTRGLNYDIPFELHSRCKQLAAWKGQTLKAWVIRALGAEVERQEAERAEEERQRRRRR